MIDIKIPQGVKHHLEILVTGKDLAPAFGSGLVNVYATPAMIALLEKTAMESILEFLPKGYTSVGTEVNIKHLKGTLVGRNVTADSFLRSFDGRKLLFELHAWDESGMIGIGTHTRVIVDEEEFMRKLK